MQLKEEYSSYEALRREHDTQIVSIALESGLKVIIFIKIYCFLLFNASFTY